jgi:hypothetical protein
LSQLTKDPKYYDAVQRITNLLEKHENKTKIPGLFPVLVSPLREEFDTDKTFTFGGMADSLYEYFSKQHMLLGGLVDQYRGLHERAIDVAKEHIFFRPLNPQNQDILLSGTARITAAGGIKTLPDGQHLACFTGGMVGIGAKIFNRTDDLDVARKLVDGCIWAYDSMPTGIMPETFTAVPCTGVEDCTWRVDKWNDAVKSAGFGEYARQLDAADIIKEEGLAPGFARINDRRFLLRYVYTLLSLSLSLSLSRSFRANSQPQSRSHRVRLHPVPHHRRHDAARRRVAHVQRHQQRNHGPVRAFCHCRRHRGRGPGDAETRPVRELLAGRDAQVLLSHL